MEWAIVTMGMKTDFEQDFKQDVSYGAWLQNNQQ